MKKFISNKPKEVSEEAFWLAWKACGSPLGMGFLQDNPSASKEAVIANVRSAGDYPGNPRAGEANSITGDYVFGRMLKLSLHYDDEGIVIPDYDPRPDYQGWCHAYPTYTALIEAAAQSLEEDQL